VALRLAPATPNPFKGSTRISFGLPRDARLSLRVFDVTGRIVRVLTDGRTWPAGTHAIHWDGMGDDGQTAAPGIYLAVLKTDRGTGVRRMVRLR
jgi:flagellar hook assembly protein FlgD